MKRCAAGLAYCTRRVLYDQHTIAHVLYQTTIAGGERGLFDLGLSDGRNIDQCSLDSRRSIGRFVQKYVLKYFNRSSITVFQGQLKIDELLVTAPSMRPRNRSRSAAEGIGHCSLLFHQLVPVGITEDPRKRIVAFRKRPSVVVR